MRNFRNCRIMTVALLVLLTVIPNIENVNKPCCERNEPFNASHHCINGSSLIFHCTYGRPLLANPKTNPSETFTVQSGVLVMQQESGSQNYTEFCVNKMIFVEDKNNTLIDDIALVCPVDETITSDGNKWTSVFGAMQFVSASFLILTTIVYIYLKELREIQDICVLNFVINLAVTYIVLGTIQFAVSVSDIQCTLLAYSLYWFSLCAFFWMNISSFNMWKSSRGCHTEPYKILSIYTFICYGIPILCVLIIIILQNKSGSHPKPHLGSSVCFFEDNKAKWYYYYSIMSILLILNITFFLDSGRILWNTYRGQKQLNRIRSLRYRFCLYLKLFLIMGIPWCFEILTASLLMSLNVIVFVTDIINCLQGLVIFIVLIATRKRVLRQLAKKNPCGLFPQKWSRGKDIETDEMVEEETYASCT